RWLLIDEPYLNIQLIAGDGGVGPSDDGVAPQERHCVIAAKAFCLRCVGFETIRPSPQMFKAPPVPYQWIEGRHESDGSRRLLMDPGGVKPEVLDSVDRFAFEFARFEEIQQYWASVPEPAESRGVCLETLFGNRSQEIHDDYDQ